MNRLKKGDTVQIMTGKDSGKTGKVSLVLHDSGKIVVEGLNMYKKHVKARQEGEKGQTVNVARAISASRVMMHCNACGKGVRVGIRIDEQGKNKVKYCKKCQKSL